MAVDRKDILEYVKRGGSLHILTVDEIKQLPQETLVDLARSRCDDIMTLDPDRHSAIPGEALEVAREYYKTKSVAPHRLPEPTDIETRCAEGYSLDDFTLDQILAIPQEFVNKRCAIGASLEQLQATQVQAIPQIYMSMRASNHPEITRLNFSDLHGKLISESNIISLIPPAVRCLSGYDRDRLILFGAGKITSKDLPDAVYVNYEARRALINIIRGKVRNQYDKICDENGYTLGDEIPQDLRDAFVKKLNSIESTVKTRQEEGLAKMQEEVEKKAAAAVSQMEEYEW